MEMQQVQEKKCFMIEKDLVLSIFVTLLHFCTCSELHYYGLKKSGSTYLVKFFVFFSPVFFVRLLLFGSIQMDFEKHSEPLRPLPVLKFSRCNYQLLMPSVVPASSQLL